MAKILPFRALLYNQARVPLGSVLTQPYDKITPEMQERYYRASPHNLARIILGKRQAGDNGENVYTRAAACFRQWRKECILVQDSNPCLYAYAQQFEIPGGSGQVLERRGFIALGQLERYGEGVVFRHEQTHSAPKADRLNLLRATRAHFGQLFMLYNDPAGEIDHALAGVARHRSDLEVPDEYGVRHRLWRIPGLVDSITAKMQDKKLIIADGHHRYETALNYQQQCRQPAGAAAPPPGQAPYDWVMMTFINMYAEGVVILPTHRVIFGLEKFSPGEMVRGARSFFSVRDITREFDPHHPTALLPETAAGDTAMIAVTRHNRLLLQAGEAKQHPALAGLSPRQAELDVVRLHKILLEAVLGISEEAVRELKNIAYVREAREAVERVHAGDQVAFLMNPVRVQQVRDLAFAGEVLPQKSTDFYPKLLSGLTIYALD